MDGVHLITSCTKRKKYEAPPRLRLGSIAPQTSLGRLAKIWRRRLTHTDNPTVEARHLYCGDHWQTALAIAASSQVPVHVWVCSAGYGLVGFDTVLAPYAATFSPGEVDSVRLKETSAGGSVSQLWWQALAEWEGPAPTGPRRIEAIVNENPHAFVCVAMSEVYLRAVSADLAKAVRLLANPDRLAIVSVGTAKFDGLQQYLLPTDARLRAKVGGAMVSLNIRLARALLESVPSAQYGANRWREVLEQWLKEQPDLPRTIREKMSDQEVLAFLQKARKNDEGASASRLLQELRNQGKACEQSRFRRLYLETKED